MATYIIKDHGDPLEKEAAEFIKNKFPYYAEVWRLFIGHKGDGTKAEMPGYSSPDKRDRFSEHTYTILESAYVIDEIIQSKTFEHPIINFKDYLEFNKSFILFFAYLGRIKDNLERASTVMMNAHQGKEIKAKLDGFYQARNVVLHGRKLPFSLDEFGIIKIPALFRGIGRNIAIWGDKENTWPDYVKFQDELAADTVEILFKELMELVNNEFANFYSYLKDHLKQEQLNLSFFYSEYLNLLSPSGTTAIFNITNTSASNAGSRC